MSLTCFKAFDVRGRLGSELNEGIAFRIGRGFARALGARKVVLARDIRRSSGALAGAVARALVDEGCEVLDLGLAEPKRCISRSAISARTAGSA